MKAADEIKELQVQEKRIRDAILKLATEVKAVLAEDLAAWPLNEVKRRFIANPEFAGTVDDGRLAEIKATLSRRGAETAAKVMAAMDDAETWLAATDHDGPGKSFAENVRLWAPTTAVVEVAREVMDAFGFPESIDRPSEYRMPMRFISGKYLPGLAEKYWSLAGELREARSRTKDLETGMVQKSLSKRWDDV